VPASSFSPFRGRCRLPPSPLSFWPCPVAFGHAPPLSSVPTVRRSTTSAATARTVQIGSCHGKFYFRSIRINFLDLFQQIQRFFFAACTRVLPFTSLVTARVARRIPVQTPWIDRHGELFRPTRSGAFGFPRPVFHRWLRQPWKLSPDRCISKK
jgi:hypothetical protein